MRVEVEVEVIIGIEATVVEEATVTIEVTVIGEALAAAPTATVVAIAVITEVIVTDITPVCSLLYQLFQVIESHIHYSITSSDTPSPSCVHRAECMDSDGFFPLWCVLDCHLCFIVNLAR